MAEAWRIEPTLDERAALIQFIEPTQSSLDGIRFLGYNKEPVPEHMLPLQMEQYAGRRKPPHFGTGGGSSTVLVSSAFRSLVLELAADAASFAPVEIFNKLSGDTLRGMYWVFQVTKSVDAIDPQASGAKFRYLDPETRRVNDQPPGEFLGYASSRWANIVLRKSVVSGLHLWRNDHTGGSEGTYISNYFFEEMKRRGMEPFRRKEMSVL